MIPAPAAGEIIPGECEDLRAGMLRLPHSANRQEAVEVSDSVFDPREGQA
jgi:hypothetical protein